ncbi:MAG: hypothetical protein ACI9JM_000604 [Halioglobus sp.]|jgi:hypothetical protein
MDNSEIIVQLARRMGSDEDVAALWLEAALDILHQQVIDERFEPAGSPPESITTSDEPLASVKEPLATSKEPPADSDKISAPTEEYIALGDGSPLAVHEEIDDSAYEMQPFPSLSPSLAAGSDASNYTSAPTAHSQIDDSAYNMSPAAAEFDEITAAQATILETDDSVYSEVPEDHTEIGSGAIAAMEIESAPVAEAPEARTPAPPPQLQSLPFTSPSRTILRSGTATTTLSVDVDTINIDNYPFRVGRETRNLSLESIPGLIERRGDAVRTNNDLYVRDMARPLNVSREHFQIEKSEQGGFALVDRGSACGTIVGELMIGGNYIGGRCPLKYGDAITVGTPESSIVFEFVQH